MQPRVPEAPRDCGEREQYREYGHQDHSVPRTQAGFHEAGVSTNNAVRPREDCKVGAVSARMQAITPTMGKRRGEEAPEDAEPT